MDSNKKVSSRGLHGTPRDPRRPGLPHGLGPVERHDSLPRWISIAGLEFGSATLEFCNEFPGKLRQDYFLNKLATFERLIRAGFECFRIPFRWERIQPRLGAPLNPDGVQQLRLMASLAQKVGGSVLLDLHNYGRYTKRIDGVATSCGFEEEIDGEVHLTADHLADFWSRIAHAMSGLPSICGYGLMNEPHDLPAGAWGRASRAAVEALRQEGDSARVFIAGEDWSHASDWRRVNPSQPWIEDPLGLVTYEAHCYLDQDSSGEYRLTYDQELEFDAHLKDRARLRLAPFLSWLNEWSQDGILGEFGVPSADRRWAALLPGLLRVLDESRVPAIWWAAGESWGDYPLSLQPLKKGAEPRPAEIELFRE